MTLTNVKKRDDHIRTLPSRVTKRDIAEFRRLIDRSESRSQMSRIRARLAWSEFAERFSEAELEYMASKTGAKRRNR